MDANLVTIPKFGYSFAEAEIASGLSRRSLERAIERGELRRVKVGNRSVIPAGSLAELCGALQAQRNG